MKVQKFKELTEERSANYAENIALKSSIDQASKVRRHVVLDGTALMPLLGPRIPPAREARPFGEP